MSNHRNRLTRAIEQARQLSAARRKKENPLLEVEWLPAAQESAERAIDEVFERLAQAIDADPTIIDESIAEKIMRAAGDVLMRKIQDSWDEVLHCAYWNTSPECAYAICRINYLPAFAAWIAKVPHALIASAVRLMTEDENHNMDVRGGVLHDWVRSLADGDKKLPEGVTTESVGVVVQAVLDANPAMLGRISSWCTGSDMRCPQRKWDTPAPWELLTACPHCGTDWPFYRNHKSAWQTSQPVQGGTVAS